MKKTNSSPIGFHIRWAFERRPALLIVTISSVVITIYIWVNASDWLVIFMIATFDDFIPATLFWKAVIEF